MRYGLRSVTMDDIAREIKVSKKTLYKYVKDKNDLLQKVMEGYCELERVVVNDIQSKEGNAIDELIEIGKHCCGRLKMMHPSIHYDMEKYYPEVWNQLEEHKTSFISACIQSNLEKGISEGLYRDNLNVKIMTKLYLSKIDLVFDGNVFPATEFNFVDVYMELTRYHIKGIASEKGVKYLKEEVKKENLNFYQ